MHGIDCMVYSRLQKVGRWIWDELGWFSFFSKLWGWGTVIFQLSGFYCSNPLRGYSEGLYGIFATGLVLLGGLRGVLLRSLFGDIGPH